MSGVIAWWARNPVAANLLMLGILLAGFLGFGQIDKEAFPQIKDNKLQIEVVWNGASAEEVESQVVSRIEDAVESVIGVTGIFSTAANGGGSVVVAADNIADLNAFSNDVKNAVDGITSMPRDIENPQISRVEYREELARVAVVGDIGDKALAQLGRDLRDDLSTKPYVSNVDLYGYRREEVSITVSERSLREFKLTFDDVSRAINASSINVSTGRIKTATGDVQLRSINLADTADDFKKIVIRQTAAGAEVTLGDVATVEDGLEERDLVVRVNGRPAVLLSVESTQQGVQIVKMSESLHEWLRETNRVLPEGVEVVLWFDEADVFTSRMGLLGNSALLGLILVFVILSLALHPTVALWVAGGIGVAYVGTFAFLPMLDVSLNVISTFALLLVLGIVVDDAIIVGESVHSVTEEGLKGSEAAAVGTQRVARPVFFAVVTTIVAFLPWAFTSGIDAQMDRVMSIVIAVALCVSMVEAFWILPTHLRDLNLEQRPGRFASWRAGVSEGYARFATERFKPFLEGAIEQRYTTVAIFISIGLFGQQLLSTGFVGQSFFPEVASEEVSVEVTLPAGMPLEVSKRLLDTIRVAQTTLAGELAAEHPEGESPVRAWYTRLDGSEILAVINLTSPEDRDISSREVAQRLEQRIGYLPQANSYAVNWEIGQSRASTMTFQLHGRDYKALEEASKALQKHLTSYSDVEFVRDDLDGELPELRIELRPGVERLGLDLDTIGRQIRQAYYGEEVQRLPRESGDVRVMLRLPKKDRETLTSLQQLRIRTADGLELPLSGVATLSLESSSRQFHRVDGERTITVIADADSETIWGIWDAVYADFIPKLMADFPTVGMGAGGAQEAEAEFFDELTTLYLLAGFAVYALLAVAFQHYFMPLLVMSAIPFALVGAVFGHWLFDLKFGMFSWFGVGAASGVVLNDNLVLLDRMLKERGEGRGHVDVLVHAAVSRFRPITLTTITTVVGLLPIMLETSTQAEFLKPAVVSLAFGVMSALFTSLFMVPALYVITKEVQAAVGPVKGWMQERGFV